MTRGNSYGVEHVAEWDAHSSAERTGLTSLVLARPAAPTTGEIRVPYKPQMKVKIVFSWKLLSGGRTLVRKVTIAKMPSYAILTVQCLGKRCPVKALDIFGYDRTKLIKFLTGRSFHADSALSLLGTEGNRAPETAIFVFRRGELPKVSLK